MLYVCSTPVGNLRDITLRALEILKSADIIACETPEHTKKLLTHYGISCKLTSYREDNKEIAGNYLIQELNQGKTIVLVSDAGTPCISDPGRNLVKKAVENGIEVIAIPGPSAVTAALSISAFHADSFLFLGFLPRKNSKREKVLLDIAKSYHTVIFFEAPHRIKKTFCELIDKISDRQVCVCREITKKFEETMRGDIRDIYLQLSSLKEIKGEFVIVIEGASDCEQEKTSEQDLTEEVNSLLKKGMKVLDAAKFLSKKYGLSRNFVYSLAITKKDDCNRCERSE